MKKIYNAPAAELNLLRADDVITASIMVTRPYVEGDSGINFGGSDFWN
jgi:hypothetical protein